MFVDITKELFVGFGLTVMLFAVTLVAAIPLGLIVSACSMTRFKPLRWLTKIFVWVIRGTPLILQIIVISFIPSTVFGIMNKQIAAFFGTTMANVNFIFVCIAFIINYAAYFSEIFRGGIESIPKGQREAAQVLGMTKGQTFMRVILPQVIKRIMAPMSNEIITLVKDTSLARAIGVVEIIMAAEIAVNRYVVIWPLFYAGAFYLIFNGVLTLLFAFLETKLDYYKV